MNYQPGPADLLVTVNKESTTCFITFTDPDRESILRLSIDLLTDDIPGQLSLGDPTRTIFPFSTPLDGVYQVTVFRSNSAEQFIIPIFGRLLSWRWHKLGKEMSCGCPEYLNADLVTVDALIPALYAAVGCGNAELAGNLYREISLLLTDCETPC